MNLSGQGSASSTTLIFLDSLLSHQATNTGSDIVQYDKHMLEIIRGTARLYHTACSTVPCNGEMNYWLDEFVVGRVHITSGKGRTGCSTDINTDISGSEGGFLSFLPFE